MNTVQFGKKFPLQFWNHGIDIFAQYLGLMSFSVGLKFTPNLVREFCLTEIAYKSIEWFVTVNSMTQIVSHLRIKVRTHVSEECSVKDTRI